MIKIWNNRCIRLPDRFPGTGLSLGSLLISLSSFSLTSGVLSGAEARTLSFA